MTSTPDLRARQVDVVVVGAGQAGLSAAGHLRRSGLRPVDAPGVADAPTLVVLDAAPAPGGAWRDRWPTLTMRTVHGVHELPGRPLPLLDPDAPAHVAVPAYYADYERAEDLHVRRPVRVLAVREGGHGRLLVETDDGIWSARALVNATGTWTRPFWPAYPGAAGFAGRQLHSHDYRGPDDMAGRDVIVVGGGTSAVQHLLEIAPLARSTTWATRRPPQWTDGEVTELTAQAGRAAVARVAERTRAGQPVGSVVSATGIPLTAAYRAGVEAGVLAARPMFARLVPDGAVWDPAAASEPGPGWVAGPEHVRADVLLWATGFRPAVDHLAPLRLRGPAGGIALDGTAAVADPRVQLVGYGPSASTIGANRAGREAARRVRRLLGV